jgi:hypothetical protein
VNLDLDSDSINLNCQVVLGYCSECGIIQSIGAPNVPRIMQDLQFMHDVNPVYQLSYAKVRGDANPLSLSVRNVCEGIFFLALRNDSQDLGCRS